MSISIFYAYIFIIAIVAAVFFVLFLRYRLKRRGVISRSINLILIAVRFPPQPPQELTLQQIREKIALMEQFYSHLHSLREGGFKSLFYGKPVLDA